PFSASVPQPPSATPFPYTTLFRSQDFADLRAQDPETAQRVLMSQVGLPGSYRRYSRERDYIQAELARGRSKDNIVAESLRTGNLDALSPFLTPEQIEGLKRLRASGALDDYLMQEAS